MLLITHWGFCSWYPGSLCCRCRDGWAERSEEKDVGEQFGLLGEKEQNGSFQAVAELRAPSSQKEKLAESFV